MGAPEHQEAAVDRAIASADALFSMEGMPDGFAVPEPRGRSATQAAVERLGFRFAQLPGQVRHALGRTRDHAGNLSSDRLQGLSEIVQNAEDLQATEVRILSRERELLVAHNGAPVRLPDVLALAMPWLTSKAEQAESTGRFGIGLMTLQSLSPHLEVHSGHYRVRIGDPDVSVAEPLSVPSCLGGRSWTVLRIPMQSGALSAGEVDDWLKEWGDSALLFLKSVRSVAHLEEEGAVRHRLTLNHEDGETFEAEVGGCEVTVEANEASGADGFRWLLCRSTVPSPQGVTRAHKAVGPTTTIALALPLSPCDGGRIYAGLPVQDTDLALFVSAQFDPIASRQTLDDTPWNRALNELLADLWTTTVLRLFLREPARAWRSIPLPSEVRDSRDSVAALESQLLRCARLCVSHRLLMDVAGQSQLALPELAVEEDTLAGVITEEEISRVAERAAILPRAAREGANRWREVLSDWEEHGGAYPATVGLYDALSLLDDETRSPEATVLLAAAGLAADPSYPLHRRRWIVDSSGTRHRVPGTAEPLVFTDVSRGLGAALGFGREIHRAYLADTHEAHLVAEWLRKRKALVTDADPVTAIRRLAAIGVARDNGAPALSLADDQLIELRDGFARVPESEREALGRDVGRAIQLKGQRYKQTGELEDIEVSPASAYLPMRLDSSEREESFAYTAGKAIGPVWLKSRYAEVLQGGGTGIGARKFLRLLGAETGPRLRRHPGAVERLAQNPKGLPDELASGPRARVRSLQALKASFTLDDYDSPDLRAVVSDIARDSDPQVRRRRAAALIHVLGRTWSRLSDHDEVAAVAPYYVWQPRGRTAAFWLWQLREAPWLDTATGSPTAPARLRMRTTSTVAVYGADNARFLHPEIQHMVGRRGDVLRALDISMEARVGDLVEHLQLLRHREDVTGHRDVPAAQILYEALAERLANQASSDPAAMSLEAVRRAFRDGEGLILTPAGWRPPQQCLCGAPLFGVLRAFAPTFKGSDEFWQLLGVRLPTVDDVAEVIKELAREDRKERREEPDGLTQSIVLQSLQMLADPARVQPQLLTTQRLGRLPLTTSRGWLSKRPVYAVEDSVIAEALGHGHAVWRPGAELEQFRSLLAALRITAVAADCVTVYSPASTTSDPQATDLARAALTHLREDLQRNSPSAVQSLDCSWETLASLSVHVAPELACRVQLADTGELVHLSVDAGIDWSSSTLYVRDTYALTRPTEAGRVIATRFPGHRREVALAWAAACDKAEKGRNAVNLSLAGDRERDDQQALQAEIDRRLREFQDEVDHRHQIRQAQAPKDADTSPPPAVSAVGPGTLPRPAPPAAQSVAPGVHTRRLVDPLRLKIIQKRGHITAPGSASAPGVRSGGGTSSMSGLPRPRPGSAVPQERTPPRPYSGTEQEKVALDLVRQALAGDEDWLRDLRAQHGLGADAVDSLARFYELKAYGGAEPDSVALTPAEFKRASESEEFFLVVVSGLEAGGAPISVRIILKPLQQLTCNPSGNVTVTGIRAAQSIVYRFGQEG
ncbi:hypothetical protein GXW83_08060 [Streptacidiphilus sp. PB12-B1b]|uniref:sacsin N-terminal ATP-binding-like domain-containing protein n=1 Tax=Streptacidiphilus sp. PB12-B1b TaxID=2705012 RepID=UPI0015FD89C1|nr:hypothetical protein [Streptacidiphilus sp. PB12-B1b]QMU75699.1 hypothetical protein GXW83_08060 [Streptacidiphilus sp. PB12-B1b]